MMNSCTYATHVYVSHFGEFTYMYIYILHFVTMSIQCCSKLVSDSRPHLGCVSVCTLLVVRTVYIPLL